MEIESKKYQVIYADPPWHFGKSSWILLKGGGMSRVTKLRKETGYDPGNVYPTMKSDEIAAMPIKDIIDKDAICFMWTTDSHLPDAIDIMKAWGFTYKTIGFVWVKKETRGAQVKMMAPWTNKGAEICLLGTKGAMTKYLGARNVSQVVEATRAKHSKKPDFIAEEIVRMFPDVNRIELFARDAKPGWDVWGNEITNTIEL
jgi:site-specific DNA-methyltransferase (adenine-specific)